MLELRKMLKGLFNRKHAEKEKLYVPKTQARKITHGLKKEHDYGAYPKFRIAPSRTLLTLPPSSDVRISSLVYPVLRPYTYVNVRYDDNENALVYNVVEPKLDEKEKKILEKIKEGFVQIIDVSLDDIKKQEKTTEFLETSVQRLLYEYNFKINEKEYIKILYYI